jgi:ABC-type dipeptide/oligopeptide/nickel transport system permease subunit
MTIHPDSDIRGLPPAAWNSGPWRLAAKRFSRDKIAVAGVFFVGALILFALAAPLIAIATGHSPDDQSHLYEMTTETGTPKGPDVGRRFFFGADELGRDVLVRTAYGARVSLVVGLGATGLALLVGVPIGMLAGYRGGFADMTLSRIMDLVLSIPVMMLALALLAVFRPSVPLIVAVIVAASWAYIARIVRGQVLSLRNEGFIEAQRAMGASTSRIILVGVLPNLAGPIMVFATAIIPANILVEAYLSFLGFGIPPTSATWGRMLSDAMEYYQVAWWMLVFPGAALFGTTLAFSLIGDGLHDAVYGTSGSVPSAAGTPERDAGRGSSGIDAPGRIRRGGHP